MDIPDDIPFPALPEKADTPHPTPATDVSSPPLPGESTDDAVNREVFEFVTEHLNLGVEEDELVREVREFGLRPKEARAYVRSVSAYNLEENYEPAVLSMIADLIAAGKPPRELVQALQEEDFTAEEGWRLLRDIEAMKLEIRDGQAETKRAQMIYLGALVLTALGCVALTIVFAIGPFMWAARLHARGKKRIEVAENLINPPRSEPA